MASTKNQSPTKQSINWFLYIVSCSDNTLYTGITTNLERRVKQHNQGKGAAYTAARRPVLLLAAWCYPDRSTATKAEHAVKRLRRARKQAIMEEGANLFGEAPRVAQLPVFA